MTAHCRTPVVDLWHLVPLSGMETVSGHYYSGAASKMADTGHVRMLRTDTKAAVVARISQATGDAAMVPGVRTRFPPLCGRRLPLPLAAVGSRRWRCSILVKVGGCSNLREVQARWI